MTGAGWLFAALAFAAVIVIVAQRGEIAETLTLIEHVRPKWLVTALGLQGLTYVMAAAVWHLALRSGGHPQSMRSLVGLALAMLVSNQAVPSVGVSGSLVVVEALVGRGVPESVAMSALLLGLLTTFAAFLIALAVAGVWMRPAHGIGAILVGVGIAFAFMAGAVTFAVFEFKRLPARWRGRLARLPIVGHAVQAITHAQASALRRPSLLLNATLLQLAEIAIDASTLGVVLQALGYRVAAGTVFGAYVIASVASRVALVPLGIGTFEAGSVTMLHMAGVPLGPALAATLIFRGLTLWLPMLPGLWCARRILRPRRPSSSS
jgi:uncharacterized protein (TIRG00374 family)